MSAQVALCSDTARLAREWDELADRVGAPPFLRPGWIAAWWRAFGRGAPELVVLRRDGRLAAVMPLRRVAGVLASPTNWHTPVFGPVAEDADAAAALVQWLFGRGLRHVSLSFLDSDDPALAAFVAAAPSGGYRLNVRPRLRSPYLTLAGAEDPEEALTGKRRRDLRRRRRLLRAQGDLTLEVATGGDRLQDLLAEAFAVEALGWKGERGTAIASRPETRRFYTEISGWAAERGWLRLCFLRLDGRALAVDLALEAGGRHYLLKTGFDPAFRESAPGVLLRQDAIRRAAELGMESYEFLGQPHPTKLEWTSTCRDRVLAQAFRRSAGGTVDWAVFTHGRSVARRVRGRVRS